MVNNLTTTPSEQNLRDVSTKYITTGEYQHVDFTLLGITLVYTSCSELVKMIKQTKTGKVFGWIPDVQKGS